MRCTGCNNYIDESAKFCSICGKNLSESGTSESYVSEQQRKEQIIEDLEEKFLKRREKLYGALVVGQLFFGIIFGFISISKTKCYSNCTTNSLIYKYIIYFFILSCIVLPIIGIINMVKNKSNYFIMRISLIIDAIWLLLLEV